MNHIAATSANMPFSDHLKLLLKAHEQCFVDELYFLGAVHYTVVGIHIDTDIIYWFILTKYLKMVGKEAKPNITQSDCKWPFIVI